MYLYLAEFLIPTTVAVGGHVLLGIPAKSPVTTTREASQKLYGSDIPSEAHKDLRAKQA